ncbi:MAG: bifunctional metallophosphatase/5'-nucleotidase [Dietzia sp.]|nr:bifunctional metallophosphatase/5'-nucleotidase [Dietzia sp.]
MAWRSRAVGAAFGAAAIGAAGLAPALAATPVDAIDESLTKVTIFNINDFHGRIGGSAGLDFACTVVKEQVAAGEYAFLSAGDNIGATPFISSSQQDAPTIEFLNALGLQASAVGNHEFDRGFDDLTDRVSLLSDYTQLGANVYLSGTATPALPPYEIVTVNGVDVGIIGVVTEETPSLVLPSGVSGLTFGDPVQAVNLYAADLSDGDTTNGEADIIIAQYHEGATTGEPPSTFAAQLAAGGIFADIVTNTADEVDAIFMGHTHMSYAWDGPAAEGTRPVIQTGSYGGNVARVELGIDPTTMSVVEYTSNLVPTARPSRPTGMSDEDYAAILADWQSGCTTDPAYVAASGIAAAAAAQAAVIGAEVVGEITADITRARNEGTIDDRLRESTLGNLTADAWLWAMNQEGRPGADIGIMNPGGLRDDLLYGTDGVVTLQDVSEVHPFANTMQVVDITGAQVITLLEQQWQPAGASRPFLKLGLSANVRYTYDPDAAQGERITGVWVDGQPIDPAATYTMASGQFLIEGGDNFTVLREGTNKRDSGMIDTDAFIDYFAQNSPISPSYEKNGVAVHSALPLTANAGGTVSFTVSGVDLTSLGAPANTSFTVYLGESEVGTAAIETTHIDGLPTRDGLSNVTFTVPADFPVGENVLTLVADPSNTTVRLLIDIAPAATGPVVETDVPSDDAASLGLLTGLAVLLTAAGAVAVNRRRQAIDS